MLAVVMALVGAAALLAQPVLLPLAELDLKA